MRQTRALGFYSRIFILLMGTVVLAAGCMPHLMSISEDSPALLLSYQSSAVATSRPYAVVNFLKRTKDVDHHGKGMDCNPFSFR